MNTPQQDALCVLNQWLANEGRDTSHSSESAWSVTAFKDAFVFSPSGGKRANRLYLVLGERVVPFSFTTKSTDGAYIQAADLASA